MFDMFWKPKYYTKCKSCVKLLKSRLDSIKKKKNSVLKYLKEDIVELLKSRLDYNAYNRAEGFLVERILLRCYELIDEFCVTILTKISTLNKQSECPDECKEAVGSLIYAAARFSDLPELRDLRGLFTGKYGSSFETFINNELIENSKVVTLTKEMKLQLLQEIAQGSAMDWNSKALEQQLYTPPPSEPDGDRKSTENRNKTKVTFVPVHESKTSTLGKKDNSDDDSLFDGTSEGNTTEASTGDSSTDQDVQKGISEYEVEDEKPFYLRDIRPPYLKTKSTNRETMDESRKAIIHIENDAIRPPYLKTKPNNRETMDDARKATLHIENDEIRPPYLKTKPTNRETREDARKATIHIEKDEIRPPYLKAKHTNRETMEGARNATIHSENDESNKQQPKSSASEEKPKPRSVRRRNVKPQPASANDGVEKISSSGNKGKETMIGEEKGPGDDEEKMLDGLLMHYSKKETSQESNKAKGNLKSQRQQEKDNAELRKPKKTKTEDDFAPARHSTEPTKPVKNHTRSNSFVHPKLPDYDQLTARFAALKGELPDYDQLAAKFTAIKGEK